MVDAGPLAGLACDGLSMLSPPSDVTECPFRLGTLPPSGSAEADLMLDGILSDDLSVLHPAMRKAAETPMATKQERC